MRLNFKKTISFCCLLSFMGIFMRFNQDSIPKSTEVRCVCCTLNLSLYKCWSMVFLRYETPVEFRAFASYAEQVWKKFWDEIFRMRFLLALIMPQTTSTISSPFEGCSLKTEGSGYIPFSTQNEELAYIRFHNWLTFWVETWIYAKNDFLSLVENTGPKWVWTRVN